MKYVSDRCLTIKFQKPIMGYRQISFMQGRLTSWGGGANKTFGTFNRKDAPAVFQSRAAPQVPFKALTSSQSEGFYVINTARHLLAHTALLPIGHLHDLGASAGDRKPSGQEAIWLQVVTRGKILK